MGSELDVLCAGLPGIEDVKKTLENLLLLAEYLNKVFVFLLRISERVHCKRRDLWWPVVKCFGG